MSIFTCGLGCRSKTDDFVSKYGSAIATAIKGTGLFFSAVVAQKINESGYGESQLASKYNNFGGIKALSGYPSVLLDTTEVKNGKSISVKQKFAVFPDPATAFAQYVNNLQSPSLGYTAGGVFSATTPEEQILRMAQSGYTTTNPSDYLNKIYPIMDYVRLHYSLGKIS